MTIRKHGLRLFKMEAMAMAMVGMAGVVGVAGVAWGEGVAGRRGAMVLPSTLCTRGCRHGIKLTFPKLLLLEYQNYFHVPSPQHPPSQKPHTFSCCTVPHILIGHQPALNNKVKHLWLLRMISSGLSHEVFTSEILPARSELEETPSQLPWTTTHDLPGRSAKFPQRTVQRRVSSEGDNNVNI